MQVKDDPPDGRRITQACSQIRWLLDPKGCLAPTETDLEGLLKVLGPAGGSAEEDPNCIPYAQLEVIFPDGRHRCVVNTIAMQFGVLLDPGMVQMLRSEPICLQPAIVIESTGRTRLATEEDQGKGKGWITSSRCDKAPPRIWRAIWYCTRHRLNSSLEILITSTS
jgi:hypothetical protein